jgi:hypothetical protein
MPAPASRSLVKCVADGRQRRAIALVVQLVGPLVEAELPTRQRASVLAVGVEDDDGAVVDGDEPLDDAAHGVRLA